MDTRISVIQVSGVATNIVHWFYSSGIKKVSPKPGFTIYKLDNNRFLVQRTLDSGGKFPYVVEIVDDILTLVPN